MLTFFLFALAATGLVAAYAGYKNYRFKKTVEGVVRDMFKQARPPMGSPPLSEKLASLPAPVQKYFRYALPESGTRITTARLRHIGYFRSQQNQDWLPIRGEEYFSVDPPAFIWFATVKFAPFLWVKARDYYFNRRGNLLIKLLSTITVANAHGREMDQSSLLRFLSEAPWLPTALLPGPYLTWIPVTDLSAKAVIQHRETKASAVFHFNELGEITRVVTEDKFREVNGVPVKERWTGLYRNYASINGTMIPTEAEAVWNLKSGDFSYARFFITEIEYDKPQVY